MAISIGGPYYLVSDHFSYIFDLKDKANVFDALGGIADVQNNMDIVAKNHAKRFNLPSKKTFKSVKMSILFLLNRSHIMFKKQEILNT